MFINLTNYVEWCHEMQSINQSLTPSMFTDLNIYPIITIGEIYFLWKKSNKKYDIFSILGRIWRMIRILIRYFTKRIRGSGSVPKSIVNAFN